MATIDLIVLGILKKEPMGAYDIQKLVEYRNISKWVKISTPSIYKKAIQLEEKGFIKGEIVKEGKMPEIPKTGMAVLQQQIVLADAIEKWIISLKKDF